MLFFELLEQHQQLQHLLRQHLQALLLPRRLRQGLAKDAVVDQARLAHEGGHGQDRGGVGGSVEAAELLVLTELSLRIYFISFSMDWMYFFSFSISKERS